MRSAKDSNGERFFALAQFLSPAQISPFFSRLSSKVRQQTFSCQPAVIRVAVLEDVDEGDERELLEDARAAIKESFTNARESVLSTRGHGARAPPPNILEL